MLGQVTEQFGSWPDIGVGRVVDETAGLPAADSPALLSSLRWKAAVGFGIELGRQIGNAQTVRPGLNKAAEDTQTGLVSERFEGIGREFDIHISRIVEMFVASNHDFEGGSSLRSLGCNTFVI